MKRFLGLQNAWTVLLSTTFLLHLEVVVSDKEYGLRSYGFGFSNKGGGQGIDHPLSTDSSTSTPSSTTPELYFEVAKPVDIPAGSTYLCTAPLLVQHSFGNTQTSRPVGGTYNPCTAPQFSQFDKVILRWDATCNDTQFGRIATVWLHGAEIMRTCTPEPMANGAIWSVAKEVTRYTALFKNATRFQVQLGNVLDATYDGVFIVNLSLDFYQTGLKRKFSSPDLDAAPAHVLKSISLGSPSDGGYWYRLNSNQPSISQILTSLPRNIYRATLEICVSFHGDDESWYTNPPNDYAQANNLSFGNGPFREVSGYIDGQFAGAFLPFPVIYTGGFNPYFWQPAAPIGAFVLPCYELELTPFVGSLVDGKPHTVTLSVLNALSVWLVDANLHLWLDYRTSQTSGALVKSDVPYFSPQGTSQFSGVNGNFHIYALRNYSLAGYVISSSGKLTTCLTSSYFYNNTLVLQDDYGYQSADLLISSQTVVTSSDTAKLTKSLRRTSKYPFHLACTQSDGPNNSTYLNFGLWHGMDTEENAIFPRGNYAKFLMNSQGASGELTVAADNTIDGGSGSLQQKYNYESTTGCFQSSVSTSNSAIVSNSSSTECTLCTSG